MMLQTLHGSNGGLQKFSLWGPTSLVVLDDFELDRVGWIDDELKDNDH